jgi:hypothetical protein
MKKVLFALLIIASVVTGSAFAQGSSPDCDFDAVVTSFADAVVEGVNCAPKSGQKTQQFKVTLHDLEVKAASNSTGVR